MNQPLSYKDAGVDIDAGDALVERIKPLARKTLREGVLAGIGGFGAGRCCFGWAEHPGREFALLCLTERLVLVPLGLFLVFGWRRGCGAPSLRCSFLRLLLRLELFRQTCRNKLPPTGW